MTVHPQAVERFNLAGKVAWVIGGAGLLGTEVSRALAEHGAQVIVSDFRADEGESLAATLRDAGLRADAVSADIGDEAQVITLTNDIASKYGKIDVMVNMTYFYTKRPWIELSAADFDACMRVSLTGAFVATREAGKQMVEQGGGSIVHFSSMYGVVSPDPQMYPESQAVNPIDYGVAKAGILQMVRYQAVQLARSGVRVNAIVPGPFPIPSTQGQDSEFMKRLRNKVPMGRVGNAPEIAGAVVFLASDAASYVTGTQITVDGGWTAW
jgi:NAD(P)-dependent dehydrogenase (short-subunit alcohol dehydrogenase family)